MMICTPTLYRFVQFDESKLFLVFRCWRKRRNQKAADDGDKVKVKGLSRSPALVVKSPVFKTAPLPTRSKLCYRRISQPMIVSVRLAFTYLLCAQEGFHLPDIGRWARRWINHYCLWLWRMANVTLDLWLPSQSKLVLIAPTHRGMARLSYLGGWLHTEIVYPPKDGHPSRH